jgi:hypothetical protein
LIFILDNGRWGGLQVASEPSERESKGTSSLTENTLVGMLGTKKNADRKDFREVGHGTI